MLGLIHEKIYSIFFNTERTQNNILLREFLLVKEDGSETIFIQSIKNADLNVMESNKDYADIIIVNANQSEAEVIANRIYETIERTTLNVM